MKFEDQGVQKNESRISFFGRFERKKGGPFEGPPRFLPDVEFRLEIDADAELEGARDARRKRA